MCIRDRLEGARLEDREQAAGEERGAVAAAGLAECRTRSAPVSYTHLRAHETVLDLVCRLLLEKKKYYNIMQ